MALRADQLTSLWGVPVGAAPPLDLVFERVCSDSRADLRGGLFVPLVGERFDGHRFLDAALRQAGGAIAARGHLDAEAMAALTAHGRPVWLVDDTLLAYQELGRLWRRQLAAAVVAVTGSAGKTTTRELIRAALAPLGAVVASIGNENNDIGAPLTLLRADATSRALVVEMGMRGLGEIERLSRCAEPDVAVITNIGTAHIGRLGSREAIATAKTEIVTALRPDGLLVIPAGDPLLEAAVAAVWSGRVERVALADELDGFDPALPPPSCVAHLAADGATLQLGGPAGPAVRLPLGGRHNARNLLLALAVAAELGIDPGQLTALQVELPDGRSRRLQLGGIEVLDETYNASPEAVLAALDLLAAAPGPGRRFAVLGTMLELGADSPRLHRQVAERAMAHRLDGLVIVAEDPEAEVMLAAARYLPRLERVASLQQAADLLLGWLQPDDRLLLKASRGVALEQLIPLLRQGLERF